MPGMIASNWASVNVAFRPIVSARAVTRSGSMPMTVCPSEARNSFGAYCASLATVSVPFDLTAAGPRAAIPATAPPADDVEAVEGVGELALLLELAQQASSRNH